MHTHWRAAGSYWLRSTDTDVCSVSSDGDRAMSPVYELGVKLPLFNPSGHSRNVAMRIRGRKAHRSGKRSPNW